MHGKYKCFSGGCEDIRCSATGDLPNRGSLGKTKFKFRCYLLTISWKKGTVPFHKHGYTECD